MTEIAVAQQFGQALAERAYDRAHALLTGAAETEYPAAALEQAVAQMTTYASSSRITDVEVMDTLEDWPARRPGDLLWAYISLAGDDFNEAAAVVLTRTPDGIRIREIEWGRP